MSDDLDKLLRTTMKTLDDQVPSGYFDALPERVSARLAGQEVDMQHGTSGTTNRDASVGGVPSTTTAATTPTATKTPGPLAAGSTAAPLPQAAAAPRDEDSGLHDIRNLAQSTKQRLRATTNPPVTDEDVLASSSASWKNLALPQPAKMVSLPELAELPSKHEIIARDKAAKAAAKQAAREAQHAPVPVAPVESVDSGAPSAAPPAEYAPAFSGFAERAKPSHRGRNLALIGMGLAAAAGITLFVTTQKSSDGVAREATVTAAAPGADHSLDRARELDEATAKLQAAHAAAEQQAAAQDTVAAGAAEAPTPPPEAAPDESSKGNAAPATKAPVAHHVGKTTRGEAKVKADDKSEVETKPKGPDEKKEKAAGSGEHESFDELLKEAGVDQKKNTKPKLSKKQLSGDDFKKGMGAVQPKAQACFKGTQGTALVKLTISPSGQVAKVTVGGVFSGKPEAACVKAAVKNATFPPWDGGPQSFGYPILLSE